MRTGPLARGLIPRFVVLDIGALGLSACVVSGKPLIGKSDQFVGQHVSVTLYKYFDKGRARLVDQRHYVWEDGHYLATWSSPKGVTKLDVVPLGSDMLVQRTDASRSIATYWVARPIFAGAYLIFPVDEKALSPEERKRLCAGDEPDEFCLVKSYDQLLGIAMATARRGAPAQPDLAVLSEDALN